jgi:hypothetical protein
MNTADIIETAQHERAAAERMSEACARIASGESSADAAWIKATIKDLRETLSAWRRLAREVEGVHELGDVALIHRDTRRLMARSIADLVTAARRSAP